MNRKTISLALGAILCFSLLTGCNNTRLLVDDPTISLNYLKSPTEDNLTALSKAYAQALNQCRRDGVKRAGLAADYAVTLALLGNQEEANRWFNKEVADFPSSRDYVVQLKQVYCPAYASDLSVGTAPAVATSAPAAAPSGEDAAVEQVIEEEKALLAGNQDQPQAKQKVSSSKSKGKGKKKPSKKPKKH